MNFETTDSFDKQTKKLKKRYKNIKQDWQMAIKIEAKVQVIVSITISNSKRQLIS